MNYRQIKAIEEKNKKRLLEIDPCITNTSGIYFLTREENGIKYAYIGQAKHILTRMTQHLSGYQHIDLSLRKHGLHTEANPLGWKFNYLPFPEAELDAKEQFYIKKYANAGYQLRNKTSGGQGEGKKQIDEFKQRRGYYDGMHQGRINLAKELKHIIDTHLVVSVKPEKENHKTSIKMLEKFMELLTEGIIDEQGRP